MSDQFDYKAINFRERKVNPRDYGADENASGETNVAAFRAAWADLANLGGGTMVVPGGSFVLNDTLQFESTTAHIRLVGSDTESRLIWTGGMGNAMVLNLNAAKVEGLRMIVSACPNIGQASVLYMRQNANPAQPARLFVRDVAFEGRMDARPAYFLAYQNGQHGRIEGVDIVSYSNESFGTFGTGILVFADHQAIQASVGDGTIFGCTISGVDTGIVLQGGTGAGGNQTIEGMSITDCVLYGIGTGVRFTASGYQAPGHSIKGGHINCDRVAVQLDSISQFRISDIEMYLNSSSSRKQGFVLLNGCTEINVHDNQMIYLPETGPASDGGTWGVAFAQGTTLSRAVNNDMYGFPSGSAGVYGQSGSGNRAYGNSIQSPGITVAGTGITTSADNINV